ncbi:MAG: nitroreductase family protein [Bacteroidota bacterium]|nr:nitroreductase family protein [Bacteroidota bacterium]
MEKTMLKDTLTVIHERKSVRHFTGEPVSKKDIQYLLRAAMAAPSAVHMLPWIFIVVTDKKMLELLSQKLPFAKMLVSAGMAIVVCVDPRQAAMGKEEFAILDGACASENILLAAEALELGAVWTAVYPSKELMDEVRQLLNIPPAIIPLNIIPVGHPTGEDKPRRKFKDNAIHWEKWRTRTVL